jgi:gamma-glutamyltranspeptidase/glutathione hydrolase
MRKTLFLLTAGILLYGCGLKKPVETLPVFEGHNVIAVNGMVVSAHSQSSAIGISVLQKGGNAVDAAVATEFALAVCYPAAGNIGGGGFMVIRLADGNSAIVDYREKAPLKATRDMYIWPDGQVVEGLSTDTHLSAGVPGTVAGLILAHSKYGNLEFRDVIQPAIDLAEKGFVVNSEQAASLNNNKDIFVERNRIKPAFVKDTEWKEGDLLKQPDLAETLERIRDQGTDGFYKGESANLIISEMQRGKGLITQKDLDSYKALFRLPLTADYKGYRIITVPPPSGGGIILLQLLGMTEDYPMGEWGFHSLKAAHLIIEAERRAFADRAEWSGDPGFVNVPVKGLLEKKYLAQRMSDFNENKASLSTEINAGDPLPYETVETTHYSVVDKDGNAVSSTTTLNNSYGSSIVVEGAGFLLNDQMDDFSVKPGFPNLYGLIGGEANSVFPGKRMLSSMTPVIVEKEGKLFFVAGSPGGSTIPTTVFQVLINVIDYNMRVSAAVDTTRFHHQWLPDLISFEPECFDSLTVSKLKQMGHELRSRAAIGRVNAIQILPDGRIEGAADRRGVNSAVGY